MIACDRASRQRKKRKNLTDASRLDVEYTLLKIFKETPEFSIGDNVNPCPKDKPYISQDNKVETQFLFKESQSIWINKVFDKTIAAQIYGSNFVIFLKLTIFSETLCNLWNF